ncbi:MAG: hypothetical protein ABIO39_01180 [Caulobacteraceae bacterium]
MSELECLADAVAEARTLLQRHGDIFTSQRMEDLEANLRAGDTTAIVRAISEATGGMGSLSDRILCVENGDSIEAMDVAAVNARLRANVQEIERRARLAAAAHGVTLMR